MKKSLAAGIYVLWVCGHRAFSWKQEWMYSQRIFSLHLASAASDRNLSVFGLTKCHSG
jgi:hypothetical protein